MNLSDNGAGRVLAALTDFQRVSKTDPDRVAISHWCDVFGYRYPDETARAALRLAQLRVQAREVSAQVASLDPRDGNPAVLLSHWDDVLYAVDRFALAESDSAKTALASVESTALQALAYVEDTLSRVRPEPVLSADNWTALQTEVEQLIADVVAADDLDYETRTTILRHLRLVEVALESAPFLGAQPVADAAESMVGLRIVKGDWWDRSVGSKWGKRIGTLVGGIILALDAAGGLPAITGGDDVEEIFQITQSTTVVVDGIHQVDLPPGSAEVEVHDAEIVEGPTA